jgi:hypothetical protein
VSAGPGLVRNSQHLPRMDSRILAGSVLAGWLLAAPLGCGVPGSPLAAPLGPEAGSAAAAPTPPTAAPAARPAAPAGPVLEVRETAGVARNGEVLRSGVPLPRSAGVTDPGRLAVVDAAGRPVPAEFRVLARWNAGLDDVRAPVQWLLVAFPATVAAKGTASYRLALDGSAGPNPKPARPLSAVRQGDRVRVDTGAAVFTLSAGSGALFDEVALPDAAPLVRGGAMTARVGGSEAKHAAVRRLWIEQAGPLSAVVVVEGAYGFQPTGGGGLGSRRRYVFTAGSPTAVVRRSVAWEGTLTPGCKGCVVVEEGKGKRGKPGKEEKDKKPTRDAAAPPPARPNAMLVERVRDALALDLGAGAVAATVVGGRKDPATSGPASGPEAWVRQLQRADRRSPLRYELRAGGRTASGARADGGMLAVSGARGAIAAALDHMHRYEPQALRLDGGELALDLVDDHVWLAARQGLYATAAVAALPASPSRADLDRLLWAPLNRPLRAWPQAAWFAGSQAVPEVPVGRLPKRLAAYDGLVRGALERTVAATDEEGLAGLTTFGLYPRYWGTRGSAELGCKEGKDPTPGQDWDDLFWCATWTDYHNTLATAPVWAMRTGEVEWLDEVAFPGALRMLHTQIMQCGPDDDWFYCGQAPAGYGAYRRDFNSSHAYF